MSNRMVIYRDEFGWNGAIEYVSGWPFSEIRHAPVTYANSAEEVFSWLHARYPDRVICHDPSVSKRYTTREEAIKN